MSTWLPSKFHQTFKEEIIQILQKSFQKTQEEGIISKSLYEANIKLTPKLGINVTREENYRPIFFMSMDAKIFNKSLADQIQQDITG